MPTYTTNELTPAAPHAYVINFNAINPPTNETNNDVLMNIFKKPHEADIIRTYSL